MSKTPSPAAALAAQADAQWTEGKSLVVCTDAHSYPGVRVLVAIRRAAISCVMSIPAKDYDGLHLARVLGFEEEQASALERAIKAKTAK